MMYVIRAWCVIICVIIIVIVSVIIIGIQRSLFILLLEFHPKHYIQTMHRLAICPLSNVLLRF